MPEPRSRLAWNIGYTGFYKKCKFAAVKYHRAQLEKLDPTYQFEQASRRLVTAREVALAQGIGPMDPGYPDIFDFHKLPDLGPNG